MKRQKGTPSDHGFTVIELVIVLAVALIVMGVALPNMISWLPTYRLSSGARQLAGDLHLARMRAISQNTKYRLRFTDNNTYEFWKDNGGWAKESGGFDLPEGITVANAVPFDTSEFQARGTVNTAGSITLKNTYNEQKDLAISIVGRVSIN